MEDNIQIDLKGIDWEVVGWIDLFQNRGRWRDLEDALVNLQVP
jgi:hypothetical protein